MCVKSCILKEQGCSRGLNILGSTNLRGYPIWGSKTFVRSFIFLCHSFFWVKLFWSSKKCWSKTFSGHYFLWIFYFLGPLISWGKKLLESEYLGMKRNLGECETFGDQHYWGTLLRNIIFGGPLLYMFGLRASYGKRVIRDLASYF